MGDINYAPVIREMTWSYSRVKSFHDCPYKWYLRYIRCLPGKEMFFASYGKFAHKLIEQFYKGEIELEDMKFAYLTGFPEEVKGRAPSRKIFESYFKSGLEYFKNFKPFEYDVIDVEKRVEFTVNGIPFVGYIDYLGEKDGELYVIDNKSRKLTPRKGGKKPTKAERELDDYLVQPYLYASAIEQEYGKRPKALCFNCFRVPLLIEEPFKEAAYEESQRRVCEDIENIAQETEFLPDIEYFRCNHLCEVSDHCEYFQIFKGR